MSSTDTIAAISGWIIAIAFVSFFGFVAFALGRVYERGTSEPEPCRLAHRDGL